MLDQETKKRIDNCRNILLGKISDPISQVKQITIALIYKFMDDMDKESVEMGGIPAYFVGDFEKYSWNNIFNPRIGGEEMIILYGDGIEKMNQNTNLEPFLRDIFKDAYLPFRDPATLKLFLKEIDWFHYSHSEKLGDAFEYLLSVLGSQGDAGQFRTPRHIIDFIVELLQPKKNERILDPACGTSGFLISSYKHILRNNTKKNLGDLITPDERNKLVENISGYDISPDMVRLSLVNLYLHNFSNPKIYEYDSLTSEERWNDYWDVILANPPFMSPKGGIRPHKRFSIQSNRAEVLFVDYIMEHLTPKGRSGIVIPEGIIFQSGTAYKSLRKKLVEKYLVGVISLPSGVFQPYSGVKTSILILDKELSQKTDKIFFGKIENDGYDLGAQRREIEKNDLPILTKEVTEYLEGLRKGKVVVSEKLTYVPKEQILGSSDIGLSYERYSTSNRVISNFEKVLLGNKEYFEIISGGTPDTSNEEYWNGTLPWISLVDLPQEDMITSIKSTKRTITELGLKNSSAKIIPIGSIVVSTRATIGRVGITEIELSTNQGFKNIIIKDKNKVSPGYLSYIVTLLKPRLLELATGGTFKEISKSNFETLEIPLPPIEVQEEIVSEIISIETENKLLKEKINQNTQKIQDRIKRIWGD
jgi:type I restriction enzyme M protein